jgi:CheY-like chemotaxis protein
VSSEPGAGQDAFLSYTRVDDDFFGGAITSLRKFLELGVQVVTGNKQFNIFQDIEGIELGQQWQARLDETIIDTRFLIPIMTPLFFQSDACRSELGKFIEHEKSLGRNDLILPIYFVTAPVLEKPDLLAEDPIAAELHKRQRYDWRSKSDLPINDPQIRVAVKELAEKIGVAISRTAPKGATAPPSLVVRDAALQAASETVRVQEEAREGKRSSKHILWVDDRPHNNIAERRAMEAYNVEFTLALSTAQALAVLAGRKFDAIISDMGRPPDPRAGYTLLSSVRADGDSTPFFIYAGSRNPKHTKEAISKGAQGSTNMASELIADVFSSIGIGQST